MSKTSNFSNTYIIVPAYNESGNIVKVISGLRQYKYPVIVVDDGSTDDTSLKAHNAGAMVLKHKVNQGKSKGAAMKTGCEYAFYHKKCDSVIFVDGDDQHLTSDIPKFISKLKEGNEAVVGTRNFNFSVPLARYMGNKIASLLVGFLYGTYVSDLLCGFRAITSSAYEKIKWESIGYGVETEMIINIINSDIKWCELPVTVLYHDKNKGVSLLDSFGILMDVIKWKLKS